MKKRTVIVIIVLSILGISINVPILQSLTLFYYQEDIVYDRFLVKANDEFTMRWIHSVELTPWEETFKISDENEIILDRTRFKQFGAGVPDSAGNKTEIKDGYIVFSGINQVMDEIPYGISKFTEHTVIIQETEYPLYQYIQDGHRIVFYTEKVSIFKYIFEEKYEN